MKKIKRLILSLLTITVLVISNLSIVLAAEPAAETPLQPGAKLSQEEMLKLSRENIIYEEDIPVMIKSNNGSRDVVPAICHLSVHYDSTNGLAFSTTVTADALIQSINGVYNWNDFGSGISNSYPFYTSSIIPYGSITNYTVVGYHYASGTQMRCNTSGTINCVLGYGTFNTTALVTIP